MWWWLALSRHLVASHKRYHFWQNVTLWRKSITNLNHTLKNVFIQGGKRKHILIFYHLLYKIKRNASNSEIRKSLLLYLFYHLSLMFCWCSAAVVAIFISERQGSFSRNLPNAWTSSLPRWLHRQIALLFSATVVAVLNIRNRNNSYSNM